MNDEPRIDPQTVQLLYSLWDASLPGRERVLAWNTAPQKEEALSREDAPDVQQLLGYFDRIGHLVQRGVFPEGFVEEFFGKEILRCHGRLEQMLASMRTQRADPSYLGFTDQLVARCRNRWPEYTPKYYSKESGGPGSCETQNDAVATVRGPKFFQYDGASMRLTAKIKKGDPADYGIE